MVPRHHDGNAVDKGYEIPSRRYVRVEAASKWILAESKYAMSRVLFLREPNMSENVER